MKISKTEHDIIYSHDINNEAEGIAKQFALLFFSIAISICIVGILYKAINLTMSDLLVIFISFSITLYLVILDLNLAYMNVYRKYSLLRKVTHQVILANADPYEYRLSALPRSEK